MPGLVRCIKCQAELGFEQRRLGMCIDCYVQTYDEVSKRKNLIRAYSWQINHPDKYDASKKKYYANHKTEIKKRRQLKRGLRP